MIPPPGRTDSLPGSTLVKTLCVVVLAVLALAAGYALVQSLANFRAIGV